MNKLLSALCAFCLLVLALPTGSRSKEFTGYSDVGAGSWSYGYVYRAQQEGFFDAAPAFRPRDTVTRAQLAKLVYKLAEKKGLLQSGVTAGDTRFADVDEAGWAYPYIRTVAGLGFMTGYTDEEGVPTGRFGPEDPVTRAQVAKVVALSGGISLPVDQSYLATFSDVSESDWFYDAVRRVAFHCVMTGYENGSFGAQDSLTREQVAKVVVKVLSPGCDANGASFGYDNLRYRYSLRYPSDHVAYAELDRENLAFVPAGDRSLAVTVAFNDLRPFRGGADTLRIEAVETSVGADAWLRENLARYDVNGNLDTLTDLTFQGKKAVQYQGAGASAPWKLIVAESADKDGKPFLLVCALSADVPALKSVLASLRFQ